MRWPLRNQILLPVAGVLVLTVALLGFLNARLAASSKQREIETRIQTVAETIAQTRFPVTATMVSQVKELADAELSVQRLDGTVDFSTADQLPTWPLNEGEVAQLKQRQIVLRRSKQFLRATVEVRGPDAGPRWLHIYYSTEDIARQRWQAILPAIGVAGFALLLVGLFTAWFSERWSRPIRALREKTKQIAQGNFRPMALSKRDDELRDLEIAVNQMAVQLDQFEQTTQQAERHRVLALLGSSLAHQLRNFATGAQLALDLHQTRCQSDPESLTVAHNQLQWIERYLRKLLSLTSAERVRFQPLNLAAQVAAVMELVEPAAQHAAVDLTLDIEPDLPLLNADEDGLHQLILNLIVNGIDASSARVASQSDAGQPSVEPAQVRLAIQRQPTNSIQIVVRDNGLGPAADVAERMFDPLVTDKRDGAGLGLSIVHRVVEQHGGEVRWQRSGGWTEFIVNLPINPIDQPEGVSTRLVPSNSIR